MKYMAIGLIILVILGTVGMFQTLMDDITELRNALSHLRNRLIEDDEIIAMQGMKIHELEDGLKTVSESYKHFRDSAGIRLANVENNVTLNKKRLHKVMSQAVMFDTAEIEDHAVRSEAVQR